MNATAAGIVPRSGRITGSGDQVVLDPAQNNSFKVIARAVTDGGKVTFLPDRARYVVSGVNAGKLDTWAAELWVTADRVSGATGVSGSGAAPRIGLGNDGWTEWLFDTYGVKYDKVTPADLVPGKLASRFDVLIMPGGVGGGGRGGRGGGGRAAAGPGSGPDDATKAVDEFVRGGGTLLAWGSGAVSTAAALQLPVRNVTAGLDRKQYFTGTSIMQVTMDLAHPVMAGMPERADVTVNQPPAFTTTDGFDGMVIAKFQKDGSPLRSGFLTPGAEKYLQGAAAAVDVRHGAGHVLLFAFNPNWRGQPTGSFRMIFNTLFFGKEVAAQAKGTPGFWTAPTKQQ
jgi:hypothetical protein